MERALRIDASRWLAALPLLLLVASAGAQNAVRGKSLYFNTNGAPLSCGSSGCHNGFPVARINGIGKGTNPATTLNAIASNKGGMGFLSAYVSAQDAADIAAYIANPAAGDGTPGIALSTTALAFGTQTVGTTSAAQTVTVSNPGTASLTLSTLTVGGANAGDFARTGTCAAGASVAPGASCTVQIAFAPTSAGARSATLSIGHNAASSPSTVNLSGTGQAAAANAAVAPASLAFTQAVNTTSAPQTVTVSNTGGMPLTIAAIAIGGTNAAEFALASGTTCTAGATLAGGGGSCVLRVTFAPGATGARTATLSIAHSASGTAATVALLGTGSVAPQPAVGLSATSLSFGTVPVGATSTAQTVTVSNTGQAVLQLTTIALSGAASGDFARAGTCGNGQSLPVGGSCSLQLRFAPTARGPRGAVLTLNSNAANGAQTLALSGNGVQAALAVSPTNASLQAAVGTRSGPAMFTLRNDGPDATTIEALALRGPFALAAGANACATPPFPLAAGQSCNAYVVFEPRAAGAAAGEVEIRANAAPAPVRAALAAQATPSNATGGGTPSNIGYGGCSAGAPDRLFDPMLIGMLAIALFALSLRAGRRRDF